MRLLFAFASVLVLCASRQHMAVAQFESQAHVLLPGSRFSLRLAQSGGAPTRAFAVGPGTIVGGSLVFPADAPPARTTLVATSGNAIAVRALRIVAPPRGSVIAVASYDDGIVFHDLHTFAMLGTLATGGAPSDVAALGRHILTTDTDGAALTSIALQPWNVRAINGVPLGDEIAADPPLHAFFVTERDLDGKGGVARVSADGAVRDAVTGTTAEGIVVDDRRQRVYVADVNDDSVAVVDADTLRVIARIGHLPRAFSLALSSDGTRLYVVSNEGTMTLFARAGRVTEVNVASRPHVIARSADLPFPDGVALDERDGRLFVTDEEANAVYVLDPRTLAQRRILTTCKTPWKPALDAESDRLFVPCASSNEVDAFDARTLTRVHGAPFPTGGYPLAVSVVRP